LAYEKRVKSRPTYPMGGLLAGRIKSYDYFRPTGKIITKFPDNVGNAAGNLPPFVGTQVTESENHPGWNFMQHKKFQGDIGGPFSMFRKYAILPDELQSFSGEKDLDGFGTMRRAEYSGPFLAVRPTGFAFPPYINSSDDDLEEYGTTAIARCAPTNPTSDLSTFLGELLSEGLPKLTGSLLSKWGSMSNRARRKSIGEEYLNYEFGWKPMVNDVRSLANAILRADSVIKQYERDSGRLVRRRYEFPTIYTEKTTVFDGQTPWLNPDNQVLHTDSVVTGKVYRRETQAIRRWFSGAFTYYLPSAYTDSDSIARKVILAKRTLGLSLTPGNIWNLMPWSWAIDWFSNAGDVLHNLDAWIIDNQVLRYGYMMEHTVHTYTYYYVGKNTLRSASNIPSSVSSVSETKIRRVATPYGFGVQYEGLNTLQKSILAALGITHFH
jgi:hypothetical protein